MGTHASFLSTSSLKTLALLSVLGLAGCTAKAESSRIDCQIGDITVEHTLVGTVSSSGDMVTGTLTVKCDGAGVNDVTFTGSTGWWAIGSVGPSGPDGVINVARPAESLGHNDIGKNKKVKLTLNGFSGSSEASKIKIIEIPIS